MSKKPNINWQAKQIWRAPGGDFLIEVFKSETEKFFDERGYRIGGDPFDGGHRWYVYAYIYPGHPLFNKFQPNGGMIQEATNLIQCHGYCSFFSPYYDDNGNKIISYKVGWDYNHLHDNDFTHMTTKEEAWRVFMDAEHLFAQLEAEK